MDAIILEYAFLNIILIVADIIFLVFVLKKKMLFPDMIYMDHQTDVKIKIAFGCILLVLFIFSTVPAIRDVPTAVSKDYSLIEGTLVNDSTAPSKGTRVIHIYESGTNESIKFKIVNVEPEFIEAGTRVRIKYLPHTKIGQIVAME